MKKIKILSSVAGTGILTTAAVLGVTSCSCNNQQTHIIGAKTEVTICGSAIYDYLEFTLNSDLKSGQTIETDLEKTEYFTFGDATVSNRLVKVPVVWCCETVNTSKTWNKDITFTCKNTDGSTAWTQKVANCSATYNPQLVITSDTHIVTDELISDSNIMIGHFKFKLGEQLETFLELVAYPTIKSEYQSTYYVNPDYTKVTVDGLEVDLQLAIQKDTAFAAGDKIEFDLQFECVVQGEVWSYWQSNKMSNLTLSYDEKEVDIPEEDLDIQGEVSTGQTLLGVKSSSNAWKNDEYNTLVIPAKTATSWVRYVGDGTNVLNLPSNIKKIKLAGLGVLEVRAHAFENMSTVKFLDLSVITDSVQSIDSLTFGSSSFSGWAETGSVIWNKGLSQYKKHTIKIKLYSAGLTHNEWFGIVKISNISQLREAAYTGGTLELQNDITFSGDENFTGQINFYESSILDLNGHSIQVTGRPIFNTPKAEFAVIGVWDCELLVTDTSTSHDGSIKAFDNSDINTTSMPESKGITTNNQWEWLTDEQTYRTRENRTFYVRSDIPTRAKGSLEILAGKFYGNCTNIMNWNTTVYIEDGFSTTLGKTKETYEGEYAPEFHLYSSYCQSKSSKTFLTPCQEMLNCKESTVNSGVATFEVYGGKFFAKPMSTSTAEQTNWHFFNPKYSLADKMPIYDNDDNITGLQQANWCKANTNTGLMPEIYSEIVQKETLESKPYNLAIPYEVYIA